MELETTPKTQSGLEPHLSFQMKHRLGALEIDAAFELTQPWTVLFGPSGSGKSTILRAIAGLFKPDHARVEFRRRKLHQLATDTSRKIFIPAGPRRFVRWCGQRSSLFPNMTVRENLAFVAHVPPNGVEMTDAAIETFRLTRFSDRRPAMLSGGEQKRAAIARAACAASGMHDVRLLLLDEPFTGLEAALRDELIADLRVWLGRRDIPVLSVTHDISEAFQLNAEVLKLQNGSIAAQGPVATVLGEERARLLDQLR
jgi:molybdate transport system ATP-binding protein